MMALLALLLYIFVPVKGFQPLHTATPILCLFAKKRSTFAPDFYDTHEDENELHIPNRLGMTTSQWRNEQDSLEGLTHAIESGISLVSIDVAQNNLNLVGRVLNQQPYQIMTTLTYRAGLVGSSGLVGKVEQLLEELQLEDVTILQAKPPKLFGSGLVSGLVECIDDGYAVHAGTMDVGAGKLKSLAQRLDERDEILVSNEFDFSLVNRKREKWFRICKNQGVIPLVRNVLGKDLLASGRWTSSDPLYKGTRKFSNKVLEKYEPLHSMLYRVLDKASARAGKAEHGPELKDYRARRYEEKRQSSVLVASQVAINYVVAKGGVPLVDVFDMESARELVGCLGWRLTDEEVKLLGQAAELSDM